MLCSRLTFAFAWASLAMGLLAGCRPRDQIARYTAPKPELIDPTLVASNAPAQGQQMLGAIVLLPQAGWFFKLTGDPALVGKLNDDFIGFVKSVEFAGEKPSWKLPAGWTERPGNEFRHATIEIPGEAKPLELSVTTLGRQAGGDEAYVLANVNRWREQLQLPPLAADELAANTIATKVGEHDCYFVNAIGTGSGGMAAGPFAGGGPFSSGGAPPIGSAAGGAGAAGDKPTFTKPAGWTEAPLKAFSIATFTVEDAGKTAEITVSSAGGDLLINVNRWRGQVGLPPTTAEELAKSAQKIETLGVTGDLVQLIGTDKTILGVVAPIGDRAWFVKLTGDPALAQREQANFESFVKSLKFQ